MATTARLYNDLAWLWPLWGDADEDYAEYAGHVIQCIERVSIQPARRLLNIGCGGGKNVWNLKSRFEVTGIDISPSMLSQARTLNPACTFVEGDMRTFDLGVRFDVVLMDDAISHMACLADFRAALARAHAHLEPGGLLVVTPDVTTETFVQHRTTVTPVSRPGLNVVFVENLYDPDPTDEHYQATIVYLIRENGTLRVETDHWQLGIFPLSVWHRELGETGFDVHEHRFVLGADSYTLLACIRR